MVVLGAALFAVPGVVLLDDSGSSAAIILALITGVAAVGGRVAHHAASSTSRTKARVVLAESEARFRALVQHATDIVVVLSETGR